MKKTFVLILLLFISINTLAQSDFSSVEERMTGKEFMESGLNKLSEAELNALNKWLRDHSVATLENATVNRSVSSSAAAGSVTTAAGTVDRRGFEGKATRKEKIVSRLVGEFTGWDGETVFTLENGMVWKQDQSDKYFTKPAVNPEITIKPGMFNAWRLSVEGYNKSLQVARIQ